MSKKTFKTSQESVELIRSIHGSQSPDSPTIISKSELKMTEYDELTTFFGNLAKGIFLGGGKGMFLGTLGGMLLGVETLALGGLTGVLVGSIGGMITEMQGLPENEKSLLISKLAYGVGAGTLVAGAVGTLVGHAIGELEGAKTIGIEAGVVGSIVWACLSITEDRKHVSEVVLSTGLIGGFVGEVTGGLAGALVSELATDPTKHPMETMLVGELLGGAVGVIVGATIAFNATLGDLVYEGS